MIGEDKLIRFSGCASGETCTVVLRGASTHVLDEAERSLHDALCVLSRTVRETRTIPGGGCCETRMARAIDSEVPNTPGKKALAMEGFARALRALPAIIADNGGFDASELVTRLRAAHARGQDTAGLDMVKGDVADMTELGIRESFKSKLHARAGHGGPGHGQGRRRRHDGIRYSRVVQVQAPRAGLGGRSRGDDIESGRHRALRAAEARGAVVGARSPPVFITSFSS